MGDPAVFGPTKRHVTLVAIARHLLWVAAVGTFLLIGMGSAGAVELLDDATEGLPVEEVTETLPVDEVVEVLPLPSPEPEPLASPEPEPAPLPGDSNESSADPATGAEADPATSPPAQTDSRVAETEPRSNEGAAPVAVVEDVVNGLDPVVADLPDPVTNSVPEGPQAVGDPVPSGSDSQALPDTTLAAVQSVPFPKGPGDRARRGAYLP